MSIYISGALRTKLPPDQRESIEDNLRSKANSICFLCDGPFNENSEDIEVDHDIPEASGGPTDEQNLNLTHRACNRSKRDLQTNQIKPYLRLSRFMEALPGPVKYDGVLEHFSVTPQQTKCTLKDETASLVFPNTTDVVEIPIYRDTHGGVTYEYCFARIPRSAIYNDADIQPRNIDLNHVRSIYLDILNNPLHEPPNVRIDAQPNVEVNCFISLFDGQHKTIATWLNGQDSVTCKIYFNMPVGRANILVNSIQSLIKKLPLSSLELSAKMSEEYNAQFQDYVAHLPAGHSPSEAGFFASMPRLDQSRAKRAFTVGLVDALRDEETPKIFGFTRKGVRRESHRTVTETALISRLLAPLIDSKPLEDANYSEKRERERRNVARMLDYLTDICFSADYFKDNYIEPRDKTRQERMSNQGSLSQIGYLLHLIFSRISPYGETEQPLLNHEPTSDQWSDIEQCIARLAGHPLWTHPLDTTVNMVALENSMQRNQNVRAAFMNVQLNYDYLTGEGAPAANWQGNPVQQPAS